GEQFEELRYAGDPVELAKKYNRQGADELVFLDITASSEGRETMLDVVRRTADEVFIPLTVGGGISTTDDIKETLRAGADKTSMNTGAIKNPDVVNEGARMFGSQCIVIAIDARRNYDESGEYYHEIDGESAWFEAVIYGGREPTGVDAVEWAQEVEDRGAGEILLTSMHGDGTKDGYDLPVTEAVSENVNVPVIASGGAGNPEHIVEVFEETEASAALAASIFHFDEYTVEEVKQEMERADVPVRL
ncbi:MAG: imidazole glycerol phosphate synthase subunit HisF, partial [Halobacteria archaeon]|nr:imidazole glycerol phosphate synthase subunit HisF [Halobacteria archaeon]